MLKFLKSIPQIRGSPHVSVVGNQSADMDSCLSALVAAYLSTAVNGRPAVPVIQIPRAEFRLRRDILYVFSLLDIDPQILLFKDDVALTESSELFLVDHNAPTVPGKPVAVIDHHEIEDQALDLSHCDPLKIVRCGSCMSAVVNYFNEASSGTRRLIGEDPILAPLALSPILMDTKKLEKKVEEEDMWAVQLLRDTSSAQVFSPFAEFVTIKEQKSNLDGFSSTDILLKDFKKWENVGISSLPTVFNKVAKQGFQISQAMVDFAASRSLKVRVALASGKLGPAGSYVRQLAIWSEAEFDVPALCPSLQLEFIAQEPTSAGAVKYYNQRNTDASRKQVAPAVREAYKQSS